MEFLLFIIALVVGGILGYFIGKQKVVKVLAQTSSLMKEIEMLREQQKVDLARFESELQRRQEEFQNQLSQQEQRFKDADADRREDFKQQLGQQLELVRSQIRQQTEQSNRQSITEIMRPYQDQLEQIKKQNIEDRATLQSEIKQFVETGGRLTREADRLVTALSGSVTIQGNLGEKMLKDILAGSGLLEGKQYILQHTLCHEDGSALKNSEGKKMRPDAALLYPQTESILYIDSKFQLPEDLDFANLQAENQAAVLKAFADKITAQARILSGRNYDRSASGGYTPLSYVVMFVPSEAALAAVTSYDATLWQRIFNEHRVCLASERNLLVLIEMVRYMWVRQKSIDNHEEIVAKAEMVLSRVVDFMQEFMDAEKSLKKAVEAVDRMNMLSSDKGHSIAVAVRELVKLGPKPAKTQGKDRQAQLGSMLRAANLVEEENPVLEP